MLRYMTFIVIFLYNFSKNYFNKNQMLPQSVGSNPGRDTCVLEQDTLL